MKSKRSNAAPAADLYTSTLFRGRRAFVERTCDQWFVLSALHGLVAPTDLIEPYDVSLQGASNADRERWAGKVVASLAERFGDLEPIEFEVHAGAAYRDFGLVGGLRALGAHVDVPALGLNQGQQLAFYSQAADGRLAPHDTELRSAPQETTSLEELVLTDLHELDAFEYRWPQDVEQFSGGWKATARVDGRHRQIRHGIGRRKCFGRSRVHTVTWIDGQPIVEGAEAEDYPTTNALISVLKRPDRKDAQNRSELPPGYEPFEIVVHRDEIRGSNARRGLALKIRADDVEAWTAYALLRLRDRASVQVPPTRTQHEDAAISSVATPPVASRPPVGSSAAQVVDALLEFGEELARRATAGSFTPDSAADDFVHRDPFAFLVAVICDEQVRFELAWEAPLRLRERLGHWDLARIATERAEVFRAFAGPPALHRWTTKTANRVSGAADQVLREYAGDARRIWDDRPAARELQLRFENFDGIGQKKAAMAVELLERELKVPIAQLAGSDIAVDVHVRRVFLRSGLVDQDDPSAIIAAARTLHPERPGALDFPAWEIGRQWCHPQAPQCYACAIGAECPRRIQQVLNVPRSS